MAAYLEAHRREPNLSVAGLLARRKAELAKLVVPRERVYLDTRFWVFLRDAFLGRPARSVHAALLDILLEGVADQRLICPLSESTFFELTHQQDRFLRMSCARLMDQLSGGVVIQNTIERVRTEVHHFISRTLATQTAPDPPLSSVWLKVGHFIGTPVPTLPKMDSGEELAVQKAFVDVMWAVTLVEMLDETGSLPDSRSDDAALADRLSRQSAEHAGEMRSFDAVYTAELAGFWDVYEHCITDTLETLYRLASPGAHMIRKEEMAEPTRQFKNMLREIIRRDKAGASLPTAQVVSGLHAIVRWNRGRGFRRTDFFDFRHAAAAVPYCDIFLTERFLATMLTRPPLSFGARFGTRIESDEAAALRLLAN